MLRFCIVHSGYGEGEQMDVDPAPGAMGQISSTSSVTYGTTGEAGFDDEPPLLEGEMLYALHVLYVLIFQTKFYLHQILLFLW